MRLLGRLLRLLVVLALLLSLVAAALLWQAHRWLHTPLALPDDGFYYELRSGGSLHHVTRDLAGRGLLDYPIVLRLYARLTDGEAIQAGEYHFSPGTTPVTLLARMQRGDVILHPVTLVEGWTFAQALATLHRHEQIRPLLADKSAEEQLALLDLPIDHPEGWFFPDTYHFARGTSDIELLRRAHGRMQAVLDELWPQRVYGLPYDTPYEALIMASIIERETGAPWERGEIAGVFVRRLEQGMRLQTDPTVIYGMGDAYRGRITRADLRRPTPYNTYTNHGLPPTPIALPGRAAIHAALNPEPGTALYFVARGDGTHVFSDTLEEHNRAVQRYQRQRREDYRSTLTPP